MAFDSSEGAPTVELESGSNDEPIRTGLPVVGEPEPGTEVPFYKEEPYKYPDDGIKDGEPAVVPPEDKNLGANVDGAATPAGDSAAPELPAHLIAQARVFDIDPTQFKTSAHLEGAIAAATQFISRTRMRPREERPTEPVRTEPAATPTVPTYESFKADSEKWDPETVGLLNQFDAHVKKQFESLAKQLNAPIEAITKSHSESAHRQAVEEFDRTVGSLKGWEPVFGKGEADEIQSGSAPFLARDMVFRRARAAVRFAHENGERLSFSKAIQQSAYALFPEHLKAIAQEEVKANTKNRQRQFTQPPTRREPGPETPDEKAMANLKRRHREMVAD